MLTCKQASNALSREDYKKLPPLKKFFLRVHVFLCPICGKFNRQVMESQDMFRSFKAKEEDLNAERPKMEQDKKDELKKLLSSESAGR
jgi:aerobic-type carbon monoxide dehydrogenase small subunit (CoxS/CutS family)